MLLQWSSIREQPATVLEDSAGDPRSYSWIQEDTDEEEEELAQPHTAEGVTFTDTRDKAPESTRVGVSAMLSRVEQPPAVLQSVRTHSSTCTWLTLARSSDCSCAEPEKGRKEETSN
ncbi:hypothetical protein EYF80_021779 [Liparis tanakae]|uniref:Uncharacterized protein n=1 Tax=Liparis tanakae TaxID=230148 RepID=A0A4Z2HQI9_9TELE|nr:hypothetical protein EYF80_021779 [Liparis tanakae]